LNRSAFLGARRCPIIGVRGGSFYGYAGAREYADICGIEEPEKSVVTTIKTAISSVVTAPLRVFRR
jgi:hypothetical protein